MKHSILFILLFHLVIVLPLVVEGQCDPNVPTFIVNLQTPATYSWISSDTARLGNCCGTSSPDRCVKFIVILPTGASGLSFNIHSGAKPPGALFYQINCGQQTAVGDSICLSGVGPHIITFCKPGANENQYRIDVFPDPGVSANIAINDGCTGILQAYGYYLPTIRWNSIYPDTFGHYNNYLNCSIACDSVVVVGQVGYPPYIDYQVCGLPEGGCDTLETCDTVRVFLNSTLTASILPQDPTVCFGGTNATLTAHGGGGTPPYRYYWSTNDTSQSISVDTGTYIVTVFDTTDCPPTYDTVTVTAFSLPIEAQAGNNLTSCDSFAQLNGNVIAASGGTWWGGAGTFSPHQDSLNAIYYPDSLELAIGYSTLFLTTTGNGSCPADTDTIVIYYEIFDDTISFSIKHVSCAGMSDAQINISSTTHKSPFVYLWSTSDSTQDLTGIDTGIYILQIQDSNGCTYIDSFVITQPLPLSIVHDSTNISCNGGSDGSITLTVSGGTTPYNYNWSSNDSTANPSGLQSGMYGVTVTDSNNCQILDSVFLSEPLLLMLSDSINQINCNGDSSGSITLFPQGGTLPYQFNWSDGPTSSTRDSLVPGIYIVVLTDSNSCQYSDSFLITQPLPLSVIHDSTNISCNGGNDGSIT
ncbi:MAG: SprB repeat-containing protein, partial [Bacteroidota bacterium]|nr:SprB repeat-containing protein [Bacteroidota bacterium]